MIFIIIGAISITNNKEDIVLTLSCCACVDRIVYYMYIFK